MAKYDNKASLLPHNLAARKDSIHHRGEAQALVDGVFVVLVVVKHVNVGALARGLAALDYRIAGVVAHVVARTEHQDTGTRTPALLYGVGRFAVVRPVYAVHSHAQRGQSPLRRDCPHCAQSVEQHAADSHGTAVRIGPEGEMVQEEHARPSVGQDTLIREHMRAV